MISEWPRVLRMNGWWYYLGWGYYECWKSNHYGNCDHYAKRQNCVGPSMLHERDCHLDFFIFGKTFLQVLNDVLNESFAATTWHISLIRTVNCCVSISTARPVCTCSDSSQALCECAIRSWVMALGTFNLKYTRSIDESSKVIRQWIFWPLVNLVPHIQQFGCIVLRCRIMKINLWNGNLLPSTAKLITKHSWDKHG